MTNHQWNGRPLVLRECQELRREITTDIALNATRDAPCSARTSLTEANTSVAACHDAVSQPAAAARGSLRAPLPLSSTIPSAKYSGAGSSLMFWKRIAIVRFAHCSALLHHVGVEIFRTLS
jgi:hypothetical protein